MSHRSIVYLLLLWCGAGCARPVVPAPQPLSTIAVFPANNQTGDPLLIAGTSFVEKYVLPTERYTVPDALVAEARDALLRRGFTIVPPEQVDAATGRKAPVNAEQAAAVAARNQIDDAVLYIDVRRWEADVPFHPTFIVASVAVTLIEPSTSRVLWRADRPSRPIQTPGVVNLGDAYSVAAHTLMTELLAPLAPKPLVK